MPGAAADYRALATRYRFLPERIVRAGAAELQRSVTEQLRRDTGGDMMLSGVAHGRRKRKPKMSASVTVNHGRGLSTGTVKASPARALGVWGWIEAGTGRREMGKLHMKVGTKWKTGPWTARGSPAKRTWTDGIAKGVPDAERVMAEMVERGS